MDMNGRTEYKALETHVIAVAVEGAVKDWAAYIGAVEGKNHEIESKKIARNGAKLPHAVAKVLFPEWEEKLDWRF